MQTPIQYPVSRRSDFSEELHGMTIADPYRWLEDIDSQETRQWIEAQNALTAAYLESIPARQQISERLTALWDFEKFGVPVQRGERYFFTRNDGLQNQAVLYWMQELGGAPHMLLDPNTLSEDGTVALMDYKVSQDGRLLAYGVSAAGSDWQDWYVRRVEDGADLSDHLEWVKFSTAAWTPDNLGFFYSRYAAPGDGQAYKDANYNHKLYYHRLGTPQSSDELVYERPDQKEWSFSAQVSEDGRYLVISVWRGTFRENGVIYKDLSKAESPVVALQEDFDAAYDFVTNQKNRFYFYTDLDAPRGRLIAIDLERPERAAWQEVIPQAQDALQEVHAVGGRFFAVYLHDAYNLVHIFDLQGQSLGTVDLPGMGSVLGFSGQAEDQQTFFAFSGFTTPDTIYRYDLANGQNHIFRQPRLLFDPQDYVTEQFFYTSKDGTRVPMFINRRRDLVIDGSTPTVLYGYGGFNIPRLPIFSVAALVWMEMGGIYAVANLRGGGEYGKEWHMGGALRHKQNVFDDFIAAGEWLISSGYTQGSRLGILGRSNGGLLVGACLTQRPDLFGAAVPVVGVLDMLRFHKFTIGWAWTSDYGSPDDEGDFRYLLTYSPYHNTRAGTAYPPTLVTTGDHDDRVFPAHSFKFAAALQAAQAGSAPVLIRIDTRAGHGLGKPTAKLIEETADQWSFLAKALF